MNRYREASSRYVGQSSRVKARAGTPGAERKTTVFPSNKNALPPFLSVTIRYYTPGRLGSTRIRKKGSYLDSTYVVESDLPKKRGIMKIINKQKNQPTDQALELL